MLLISTNQAAYGRSHLPSFWQNQSFLLASKFFPDYSDNSTINNDSSNARFLEHFSEYFRIVTDCYIFENLTSNHEKVELILATVQQDSTWEIDRRHLEVQYISTLTIIIMYPPILFLVIGIKT